MSDIVIHVENLSKKYTIGRANGRANGEGLRHALQHAATAPFRGLRKFGKQKPGSQNNFTSQLSTVSSQNSSSSEEFFALKNVSFDVRRGEVLGIIGRNGAGKSTLLKILSRITDPTSGRIGIKGRVASLLEVGTGFHPELTGRENIFLNGAILGMSRTEIKRKFDEIVAFAEIEQFLDTPVKRYSSGMYVRLAFAVAAHLEPEILIVDEVLAVGDAEFQKKCLGKMQDVAGHGRTVLFVSHNLGMVSVLCSTGLLLESGQVKCYGNINVTTERYRQVTNGDDNRGIKCWNQSGNKKAQIIEIEITNMQGHRVGRLPHTSSWNINIKTLHHEVVPNLHVTMHVEDSAGLRIFTTQRSIVQMEQVSGYQWSIPVPGHFLMPRIFSIVAGLHIPNVMMIDLVEAESIMEIIDDGSQFSIYGDQNQGCVFYPGDKEKDIYQEADESLKSPA